MTKAKLLRLESYNKELEKNLEVYRRSGSPALEETDKLARRASLIGGQDRKELSKLREVSLELFLKCIILNCQIDTQNVDTLMISTFLTVPKFSINVLYLFKLTSESRTPF